MTPHDWQALVERFAPRVQLSRTGLFKDRYGPASVEWYLERCTLRDHDDPTVCIARPTVADLACHRQKCAYLKPDNEHVYNGDWHAAPMYAHVRAVTDAGGQFDGRQIDIQYWFFHPYNGPIGILPVFGAHEADWEHVTVRVSRWRTLGESAVEAVFFAAHGHTEGSWLVSRSGQPKGGAYTLSGGSHVDVWSAWHSHASYERRGLHLRSKTYFVANDVCSGGGEWGPLEGGRLVLVAVDEAVCGPGDTGVDSAPWLSFGGRWGSSEESPRGPSQQGTWRDEGSPAPLGQARQIAGFGEHWGEKFGTTCVALGALGGRDVLAVGRKGPDHDRFFLFGWQGDGLVELDGGGAHWPDKRGCRAIAVGAFGEQGVLAIAPEPGDDPGDVELYRPTGDRGALEIGRPWQTIGADWGETRACAALALGRLGGEQVLGVALEARGDASGSPRFEIYRWQGALARWQGGESWPGPCGCTAIAFGDWGGQPVVAVGRSAGPGARIELHAVQGDGLVQVPSDGDLPDDVGVADLAFGEVGGQPVLAAALTADEGLRFIVLAAAESAADDRDPAAAGAGFASILRGGEGWGAGRRATGVAFGDVDGEQVMVVSRSGRDNMRVALYRDSAGRLLEFSRYGNGWGKGRNATAVAIGSLGDQQVIAYGRNDGKHGRGGLISPL